jgi:transcriptional regulator with XRE-family HTH domain
MPSQVPRHLKVVIAENIRAARDGAGLTQAELAKRLNMESINVSRWERALVTPNLDNFAALADALGHDIAWFYTDHEAAAA